MSIDLTSVTLTDIRVDQRGHRQVWTPYGSDRVDGRPGRLTGTHVASVEYHTFDVAGPIAEEYPSVHDGVFACATCDAYPSFSFALDPESGETILRAKTECAFPDGLTGVIPFVVTSGRIVVGDDLRPVFDMPLPDAASYNSAIGQVLYAQQMAAVGVVQGAIGSPGASLYRVSSTNLSSPDHGRYVIASIDEEAAPSDPWYLALPVAEDYVDVFDLRRDRIADFDGAVHAYSFTDYANWLDACAASGLDSDMVIADRHLKVVDFPNGHYVLRHFATRTEVDAEASGIFAEIRRLSSYLPPRPRTGEGNAA